MARRSAGPPHPRSYFGAEPPGWVGCMLVPGCAVLDGNGLVLPGMHGRDTVPGGQGSIVPVPGPGPAGDEFPLGVLLWGDWGTLPGIRGWVGPGAPGNVPGWAAPGNPGVPGTPGVVVCADAVPVTKAPTRATAQAVFQVMARPPSGKVDAYTRSKASPVPPSRRLCVQRRIPEWSGGRRVSNSQLRNFTKERVWNGDSSAIPTCR